LIKYEQQDAEPQKLKKDKKYGSVKELFSNDIISTDVINREPMRFCTLFPGLGWSVLYNNKPVFYRPCEVEVEVKLRPTVSRPVRFGVRHPSGTHDQSFFLLEIVFR
jgi:hypothetical protein